MKYVFLLLLAATASAATSNEIAQAIHDLGASDHKTREAASAFLTSVGKPALAALERAVQDSDPEIRSRAIGLLPIVRFELSADFPPSLREALGSYPTSDLPQKQATVSSLLKSSCDDARRVVLRLAEFETNLHERVSIFGEPFEPFVEKLTAAFETPGMNRDLLPPLLADLEFYQRILPDSGYLPFVAMKRLKSLGLTKEADDTLERIYLLEEKMCEEDPHDADQQNLTAWLCAKARRRLDVGLQHIQQAITDAPDRLDFWDTKAELLFQNGQNDKALKLIEECIKRSPSYSYFRKQQERFLKGDRSIPPPDSQQE